MGIPTAPLSTHAFKEAADRGFGHDTPFIYTKHPVVGVSDDVLTDYIKGEDPETGKIVFDEIIDALTKPPVRKDVFSEQTVDVLKALGVDIPTKETADPAEDTTPPDDQKKDPGKEKDTTEDTGKKKQPRSMTRMAAVVQTFKAAEKGIARNDLVEKSDALYLKHGGKGNLKEAKWATKLVLDVVEYLGLVEEKDGKLRLTL